MLTAKQLNAEPGFRHGFFTRAGGVSRGIYDSLNCGFGSGDDLEAVAINRGRALADLGGNGALVTARQAHTATAVVVETAWTPADAPTADALVTRTPGIALGILTADCAPVLIADSKAGVIGAAHAGWRGALSGVIEATIETMKGLGAVSERMVAAIGPCIRQPSYEVGPDMKQAFTDVDPAYDRFFRSANRGDRLLFDLAGFATSRLAAAGVQAADVVAGDTFADEGRFFSYRRNQKAGERRYGRGLSAIRLT